MLVKLTQGFATYYDGKKRRTIRANGVPANVPDDIARRWIERDRAVAVDAEPVEPEPVEPEPVDEEPEEGDPVPYSAMTAAELKAECKARGIKFGSAKKAKLVELLEADDAQLDEDLEPFVPEG